MENLEHLVRLNLTGRIAVRGARRLAAAFGGDLGAALRAPLERVAAVLGPDTAAAIHVVRPAEEIERACAIGARIVPFGDPGYPQLLREIYDPPLVLYVLGELRPAERAVAVVGSRRATPYGRRMTDLIARGLAEAAVAVVSGLARGIDAVAHRAALAQGGRTIAVLGSGLCRCYPPEHEDLLREIARRGAVVTEFPLDAPPFPHHFPRRNRIVSGLSLGVCVVEAGARSGSLVTAEWALEQGREVFAVPHRAGDPGAPGVHRLLREGAGLVETADDIIGALGLGPGPARSRNLAPPPDGAAEATPSDLSPTELRILAALGPDPRSIDEIIEEAALPASTVFAALTRLELRRIARGWPGRLYQRA